LKRRLLTENEATIMETLIKTSARLMHRCRQIRASIESINSKDPEYECPRCDEVADLMARIEPDWRALKSAFCGLVDDCQAVSLSARLLELIED
jgi:hypothetical protein